MRTLLPFLVVFLLCAGREVGAVEGPFMPFPNTVDHVVTRVSKDTHPQRAGFIRTITHHGTWTRVDGVLPGQPQLAIGYIDNAASVSVSVPVRGALQGISDTLSLRRGVQGHPWWQRDPFRTGERRIVLGEACEVWNVARTTDARFGHLTALSCVTDDGIELASYRARRDGVEEPRDVAIKLERRPVRPEEVQPPAGLLDLGSWLDAADLQGDAPPGPSETAVDHEAVMNLTRHSRYRSGTRIRRRRGAWTYTETVYDNSRRVLVVLNEVAGFDLSFDSQASDGGETLTISRLQHPSSGVRPGRPRGAPTGRHETIMGENCVEVDLTPGMMDARSTECRAQDGVVLKESDFARSFLPSQMFEAVQLRRRQVRLDKVLPPSDILSPSRWGLPR